MQDAGGTTPEICGGRRNLDAHRQYGHPHHGEDLQLKARTEYWPEMQAMVQQAGLIGSHWRDDNRVILREQKKVDVEEVQALQEGENVTLFNGTLLRCSALYIKDADKFASEAVRINRSSPRPRGIPPLSSLLIPIRLLWTTYPFLLT